jgi:hypothetical protein
MLHLELNILLVLKIADIDIANHHWHLEKTENGANFELLTSTFFSSYLNGDSENIPGAICKNFSGILCVSRQPKVCKHLVPF